MGWSPVRALYRVGLLAMLKDDYSDTVASTWYGMAALRGVRFLVPLPVNHEQVKLS
jgi:hypothetical protein